MKKLAFVLGIAFCILSLGATYDFDASHQILTGQLITLKAVGAEKVVIVRPDILEVVKVTAGFVDFLGKKEGQTLVEIYTAKGKTAYDIKVIDQDIDEFEDKINNLLTQDLGIEGVSTKVNYLSNKVILQGVLAKGELEKVKLMVIDPYSRRIESVIDEKEEKGLIDIQVEIIELQKGASKTLGFTVPAGFSIGESEGSLFADGGGIATGTTAGNLFNVLQWSRTALAIRLDLLEQQGKARILSRPHLACQSGKEAELRVGGEKPIMTTVLSEGSAGTEVSYKEYGIKLNIAPEIVNGGKVHIKLEVEVSEVDKKESLGSATAPSATAYPLLKRSTTTELTMKDGQTLAISGLIKEKKEESTRKVAFLGDLPVIGSWFRNKTTTDGGGAEDRGDSELVVLLTPRIIEDKQEIELVKRAASVTSVIPKTYKIPQYFSDYVIRVQNIVVNSLPYPQVAKDAGWQASLKVSMHLLSSGELLTARVTESSGYKVFDDNTVSLIQELSPYPPFPAQADDKEMWIDIPIVYSLE